MFDDEMTETTTTFRAHNQKMYALFFIGCADNERT